MFGGGPTRNAIGIGKNPPTRWAAKLVGDQLQPALNIKWIARAGYGMSMAAPVIAERFVWVGANNESPRDQHRKEPAPVLMCFRETDGAFVWQYIAPIGKGLRSDSSYTGIKCSPLIEGDRLWFTTPGVEVVCLDIGPLRRGEGMPVELWKIQMAEEFGVFVHPFVMGSPGPNSIALYDRWIFVNTDNGVDWSHVNVPSPLAPSLVCLEKETGKLVWEDNSPGSKIFHVQWSSPLAIKIDGSGRVFAGMGDGKMRSFGAVSGKMRWEIDCNAPEYRKKKYPNADGPSEILATPVYHNGRIYVAIGQEPEHGEGRGNLVCVDATTGALIWQNQKINRSISSVVVLDGKVYACDFSGFVYALNADTGTVRWRYDARAHIWASPLVVDGFLYIVDEDGDATVFELQGVEQQVRPAEQPLVLDKRSFLPSAVPRAEPAPAARPRVWVNSMPTTLYAPPVYANGVLYLNAGGYLCAIAALTNASKPIDEFRSSKVADAVFVPTPQDVVERMLEIARVTANNLVVDLGSGDGRIVITAARKYGSNAVGYEIDPVLVNRSRESIRRANLGERVRIDDRDIFTVQLGEADVVAVFLPPSLLQKLIPQFKQLKPGSRIVSHDFSIPGIPPDESVRLKSRDDEAEHTVHLWEVPLKFPIPDVADPK